MHRLEGFGTVEKGKQADLLVVAADPAGDIKNLRQIRYVIKGGVVRAVGAAIGGACASNSTVIRRSTADPTLRAPGRRGTHSGSASCSNRCRSAPRRTASRA